MQSRNWVSKPEAVLIFAVLHDRGTFSLNDISVYSKMLEFHYYGDEQQKAAKIAAGEMTYYEAIGADYYEYKRLRAKLRKVGLMTYSNQTKRWLLRNPELVVADSREYQTASKTRQQQIVGRITGKPVTYEQTSLQLVAA